MIRSNTTASRVTTSRDRQRALNVLNRTYADEKQWVDDAGEIFPESDLNRDSVTWVLATVNEAPAGVVRIHYDPALHQYGGYELEDVEGDHDATDFSDEVEAFITHHDIAEIGRFAVLPEYRHRIRVVFWLMRVAGVDTFERGYSHYVTDVFEDEEHSPYNFHTRVLGFEPVATHETGEMNCLHRRITLILDLPQAYRRLRETRNRIYRFLAEGLSPDVRRRLAG